MIANVVNIESASLATGIKSVNSIRMDPQLFSEIKTKYGHYASWAIWPEVGLTPKSNMGDLSIFDPEKNKELFKQLNPNVVMVGLNISAPIDRPFGNFHSHDTKFNDYKVRYAFKGTPHYGAYMTDIIKDFEQKISGQVMKYLRANPEFENLNIRAFEQELKDIGANDPTLIAFGGDVHQILQRHFKDQYRIVKIPHYSHYLSKENYKKIADEALFLNKTMWAEDSSEN